MNRKKDCNGKSRDAVKAGQFTIFEGTDSGPVLRF